MKHNQCNPSPTSWDRPDVDTQDQSTVKVTQYSNSKNSSQVLLYTIEGGGHCLPGSLTQSRPRVIGPKNMDIVAIEEIWNFFKQYP